MKLWHTLLVCWLSIGTASSLASAADLSIASSSDPPARRVACVVSTKRNGGHRQLFTFPTTGNETSTAKVRTNRRQGSLHNLQSGLRSTFLPSGWPASTPAGYLRYSVWSWLQDLSTNLRSVLATQRILEGVGVGRQDATALSALLNFLIRDGCGMAATLIFTAAAAERFRSDVKRWRLFADIMVDIGITLEVAALHSPALFLLMICLGNMCKAICGVAAGACGGSINLHWAKGSDISDIQAKFGAQHTVTGSLGLLFAAVFAKSVSTLDSRHLWSLYAALTALHIYANTRCMRLIAFDYMNTERLRIMADDFLRQWPDTPQLPTPDDIASLEPLLFLPRVGRRRFVPVPIHFGVGFPFFSEQSGWSEADLQAAMMTSDKYVIATGRNRRGQLSIVVALVQGATPLQQTKAYFHALLLKRRLGEASQPLAKLSAGERRSIEAQADSQVQLAWRDFYRECTRSGWDLRSSELRSMGYEINVQYRQ